MNSNTGELLEIIRRSFMNKQARDKQTFSILERVRGGMATQEDAAEYAERLGELLSETLQEQLTSNSRKGVLQLPEGVGDAGLSSYAANNAKNYAEGPESFYKAVKEQTVDKMVGNFHSVQGLSRSEGSEFKFWKETVDPMLKEAYERINGTAAQIQKSIDEKNGLGLKSIKSAYPQERIDGLLEKIIASDRDETQVAKWLGEPIVNNCQAFYDSYVQTNAEARFNAGLPPVIVRTSAPGCCDWCAKHAGVYDYEDVRHTGSEVFRRHQFCRCTVSLRTEGLRIEAWGRKQWEADQQTLEKRKVYGLKNERFASPPSEAYILRKEQIALAKAAKSSIIKEPDIYIGRSVGAKAKNYRVRLPDGTYTELAENTSITNIQVIAGKGRRRDIDAIETLMAKFPESTEEEWQKKKGFGYVDVDGESFKAELHWFEEHTHDIIYDMKVKPDKSGNWYYDDSK